MKMTKSFCYRKSIWEHVYIIAILLTITWIYDIDMVGRRFVFRRVIPTSAALLLATYLTLKTLNVYPFASEDNFGHRYLYKLGKVKMTDEIKEEMTGNDELHKHQFWEAKMSVDYKNNENINFVFIKCMKCATETVGNILRRYAFTRDLNVALPRSDNIYLGWPYLMETADYRDFGAKFNCLIEHSVYNSSIMRPLFNRGVKFITIIREPWSHFLSTFKYFNVQKIVNIEEKEPVSEYLRNLDFYESVYKSSESAKLRYCIPDGFSVTKNLLSHCMGMPLGFPAGHRRNISSNRVEVKKYIDNLDKEMDLVMIMEYFDESMILLKRIMNWSMKDIVYKKVNAGHYRFSSSDGDRMRHRKWSSIDYRLYKHFNRTFWGKVKSQGVDFIKEVNLFKMIVDDISTFCKAVNRTSQDNNMVQIMIIPPSVFDSGFTFTSYDCEFMDEGLLPLLQKRFAHRFGVDQKYKRTC